MKAVRTALFVYLAAFLLVMSGCGQKLRPDPSLSSIAANYPTAEFRACGKLHHGLGVCVVREGSELSAVQLKLQGYHSGEFKVDSVGCETGPEQIRYSKNKLYEVPLSGKAEKSCVVSMTVSPTYDNQKKSGIKVHGFRGHFYLKVIKEGEEIQTNLLRESGNWKKFWKIPTGEVEEVRVFATGCGLTIDKKFTPSEDTSISLPMHSLTGDLNKTCVIEGVIQGHVYKDLLFTALVAQYESAFVPLAEPVIEIKNGKLSVEANESVSIISVGDDYQITTKATFSPDLKKTFTVRLLTVKGRSLIGEWNPQTKEVVWVRF